MVSVTDAAVMLALIVNAAEATAATNMEKTPQMMILLKINI